MRRFAFAAAAPALLCAVSLSLAGCATEGGGLDIARAPAPSEAEAPAAEAAPAEPEWIVGAIWPVMDDGPLLAAARTVLETCALGVTEGLETASLEDRPRGLAAVEPSGAEKLALGVFTPATEPAARELRLRWVEGVGPGGRVAVIEGVRRVLQGAPPCPAAGG